MIVEHMTDLIGDTPLLKIPAHVTGLKNIDLYAKLEMMNPFGSVKDRTVWGLVKDDLDRVAEDGMTIYENSSGNTAKSLSAIAGTRGIKFKLVTSLKKVQEQKDILQILGAEIQEIVNASNCFDPSDPNDPQYLIEKAVTDNPGKVYFPSQFTNRKNPDFHAQTTAQEILDDLDPIDFFFGGLGTTGSSLGITERMKAANPDFKSIGVTAELNHFIPGIRGLSQMMESELFQRSLYDNIVPLTEMEALEGVLTLSRQCGVLCGPSSGANFQVALRHLQSIDKQQTTRKKAVFIVCDRLEWYISYVRERMPELFGEKKKTSNFYGFNSSPIDIVPQIKAHEIEAWMKNHPHHIVIDTRGKQSFDLIHIPGSINVPQEMFEKWIDNSSPFAEGTSVLIICAVGERSRHYAAYLNHAGVKAFNLEGGIMAWSDLRNAA